MDFVFSVDFLLLLANKSHSTNIPYGLVWGFGISYMAAQEL